MYKLILLLTFLALCKYSNSLEVTLTQGSVKPTPIAVTELFSNNTATKSW